MKNPLCIVLFMIIGAAFVNMYARGSGDDAGRSREVVVYAYDSFVSEWGPGPELKRLFEEKTGYTVTLVSCGDAAEVLSRAVREKSKPRADVLVGIDTTLLAQTRASGVLVPYRPKGADEHIPDDLVLSDDWLLTPYDWGVFSIICDTESDIAPPASLEELTGAAYRGRIILMDPRMSTPGAGFLAWTMAVYGERHTDYWERLKPNILTLAPGWDAGYGLFVAGEAPLVISYTTSPAYHQEYEQSSRFRALVFPEGHIRQIEGAGMVRGAGNQDGAAAFLDFLISSEAQNVLPLTQWMYPVNASVPLPDSYRAAPAVDRILPLPDGDIKAAMDRVLDLLSR